jgi:hypothetical protein
MVAGRTDALSLVQECSTGWTDTVKLSIGAINVLCSRDDVKREQPALQQQKNRCPPEYSVVAITSARATATWRSSVTRSSDAIASVHPMIPEIAVAMSESTTATSERRVTGRTDAPAPEVPMPTQKYAQRLQTASSSVWPIYMCSPGHFEFAGVPRHHTHIQEHLQTIQEHIDQILSP